MGWFVAAIQSLIALLLLYIFFELRESVWLLKAIKSDIFDMHVVVVFGRNPKEFGGDGPYEGNRPDWIKPRQI